MSEELRRLGIQHIHAQGVRADPYVSVRRLAYRPHHISGQRSLAVDIRGLRKADGIRLKEICLGFDVGNT